MKQWGRLLGAVLLAMLLITACGEKDRKGGEGEYDMNYQTRLALREIKMALQDAGNEGSEVLRSVRENLEGTTDEVRNRLADRFDQAGEGEELSPVDRSLMAVYDAMMRTGAESDQVLERVRSTLTQERNDVTLAIEAINAELSTIPQEAEEAVEDVGEAAEDAKQEVEKTSKEM